MHFTTHFTSVPPSYLSYVYIEVFKRLLGDFYCGNCFKPMHILICVRTKINIWEFIRHLLYHNHREMISKSFIRNLWIKSMNKNDDYSLISQSCLLSRKLEETTSINRYMYIRSNNAIHSSCNSSENKFRVILTSKEVLKSVVAEYFSKIQPNYQNLLY